MQELNEGDYHCDKCNVIGNFTDGTMWGVGNNNLEFCFCNECLENYLKEEDERKK